MPISIEKDCGERDSRTSPSVQKMRPKVSRDGRFYWDNATQSWQPMPAHLQPQPRQRKEKRKGGVFISSGTIILIIIVYLVLHHMKYAGCAIQPDLFNWQDHCPYYLP